MSEQTWKRPDEFLKLQRLKQKQKALAARLKRPSTQPAVESKKKEGHENSELTAKRRNPFAR